MQSFPFSCPLCFKNPFVKIHSMVMPSSEGVSLVWPLIKNPCTVSIHYSLSYMFYLCTRRHTSSRPQISYFFLPFIESPLLCFPPSVGWATSTQATVAANTCWRRVTTSTLMNMVLAAPRCSPWGVCVTCSGTRTAATPWPASEASRGWEREGEVGREREGVELMEEGEDQGTRRREGLCHPYKAKRKRVMGCECM